MNSDDPIPPNGSTDDGSVIDRPTGPQPLAGLTGFQRDVLFVVANLEGQGPNGKTIKHELDDYYAETVSNGRLYQNLRELTDDGFVERYPIDGRTNAYQLTDPGCERLEAHSEWIANRLRRPEDGGEPSNQC